MHPNIFHPQPSDEQPMSAPHLAPVPDTAAPATHEQPPLPPAPTPVNQQLPTPTWDQPVPVVRVLSIRGVEYGMMTLTLWVAASALGWIFLNMLNGSSGYDSLVVPISALVVCLPVFGLFFVRLKRAELRDPNLRVDASKRRWSQTTQFLAFIACIINVIYFVYTLLQHTSGKSSTSIGKSVANLLIILVIAGGILAYYWFDEHRTRRS